ncbi:MAG: hypothetical protein PHT04_06700 [Eubacteriales bacterium]|nr:hypothetical protein [Eubacteriales bacterium]
MKKFRIFLYSFLFFAIIVLAFFYFAPFGKITYRHNFSRQYLLGKGFFHKIGPSERVVDNKIMGDPVYFYLNSPRNFSQAKLTMKYKISPQALENNDFINIEAGVLVDKENWRYNLKPVFNNVLLNLSGSQNIQFNNDLFFYQKNNNFKNYQDFLDNKDFSSAVFYNYNLNYQYFLPNYHLHNNEQNLIIENIRGSYSFYTYIKNENLDISFDFLNLEKNSQNDIKKISILVYFQDKLIFSEGGIFSENNSLNYLLSLPDLPEGSYKVEIKADDQVLTKKIDTKLTKLSFINRIWLDQQNNGFTIFSNKNNFRTKALESVCLGEIEIDNKVFVIDKIFQQFNIEINKEKKNLEQLTKINSDSCGFLIENNGLFSFSEDSFFDPTLNKLDQYTNIEEIEFILADFSLPQKINDYYVSEININLEKAVKEKDGYNFIISAPFLKNIIENECIEIKEIEIELIGKNLFTKIKEKINERFKR